MISVILPTLNEDTLLPGALGSLEGSDEEYEALVVDGGSADDTVEIARSHRNTVAISCATAHRATQMNLGAARSRGRILLFLHADTRLPRGGLDRIRRAMDSNADLVGGAFARYFDSTSRFLRLTCELSACRGAWTGLYLGDQAMFVRRDVFETMGGFPEITPFEDVELALRIRELGVTALLRPPVISSARRFEARGPVATTWSDFRLTCRYLARRKRGEMGNRRSAATAASGEDSAAKGWKENLEICRLSK